uniref:Uncharacterized protein n=1 Tax=Helianthus annuus TaxID=4232 RepID=A0A251UT42_HELAN
MILVLSVVDEHSGLRLPDETQTEVFITMRDMLHSYVKWHRQYAKLLDGDAPSFMKTLKKRKRNT